MPAERKVFQSTYLHWGEYDPATRQLTLQFTNGHTMRSSVSVPLAAWEGLRDAMKPGTYFHDNIKPFWIPVVAGGPEDKEGGDDVSGLSGEGGSR